MNLEAKKVKDLDGVFAEHHLRLLPVKCLDLWDSNPESILVNGEAERADRAAD